MPYTDLQQKAIARYQDRNDCVVQLSTYPTVYFKKRSDGSEVSENISTLVDWYKAAKKEEQREAARQRRLEKKQQARK